MLQWKNNSKPNVFLVIKRQRLSKFLEGQKNLQSRLFTCDTHAECSNKSKQSQSLKQKPEQSSIRLIPIRWAQQESNSKRNQRSIQSPEFQESNSASDPIKYQIRLSKTTSSHQNKKFTKSVFDDFQLQLNAYLSQFSATFQPIYRTENLDNFLRYVYQFKTCQTEQTQALQSLQNQTTEKFQTLFRDNWAQEPSSPDSPANKMSLSSSLRMSSKQFPSFKLCKRLKKDSQTISEASLVDMQLSNLSAVNVQEAVIIQAEKSPNQKMVKQSNFEQSGQTFSIVRTTQSQVVSINELENKINQIKNQEDTIIHQSYFCDECFKEPIVGKRYKCIECDDYDLCHQCYERKCSVFGRFGRNSCVAVSEAEESKAEQPNGLKTAQPLKLKMPAALKKQMSSVAEEESQTPQQSENVSQIEHQVTSSNESNQDKQERVKHHIHVMQEVSQNKTELKHLLNISNAIRQTIKSSSANAVRNTLSKPEIARSRASHIPDWQKHSLRKSEFFKALKPRVTISTDNFEKNIEDKKKTNESEPKVLTKTSRLSKK